MMNTVSSVVCLAVFIALPLLSSAWPREMHGERGEHEVNELSPSDFFSSLDENSDGSVTSWELNQAAQATRQGQKALGMTEQQQQYLVEKYDWDKSGDLSGVEMDNLFKRLDVDGNGQLTLEELSRRMTE